MKKLLVSLALLGILMFVVHGAFAETQGVTVTIGQDIHLVISPTTVNFGSVSPGTSNNPSTNGNITFDATNSNVDVTITVASITGFPFQTGLMLDGASATGQDWTLPCVKEGESDVCTYTMQSTVPTLNVPIAAAQATQNGVITYTVSGPTP